MSIDDWYADRQDGSFGDSPDDEVVEFTAFAEVPPEFLDEPLERRPSAADLDALRRRNGLAGRPQPPAAERRDVPPTTSADVVEPGVPRHLRDRIIATARQRRSTEPRAVSTLVRLGGADVTVAQVAEVLQGLTPAERDVVLGRRAAVQRGARHGAPQPPQRPGGSEPRRRHIRRPIATAETCPACGVCVQDRGLCACS